MAGLLGRSVRLGLLCAGWLAGCAPAPVCLLASQKPAVLVTLYFGQAISGRGPVSEAAWAAFASAELTRRFPDGFTVYDAEGQWRDPASGTVSREATRVVQAVAAPQAGLAGRVSAMANAYRAAFHQVSVGVVSERVCAAF